MLDGRQLMLPAVFFMRPIRQRYVRARCFEEFFVRGTNMRKQRGQAASLLRFTRMEDALYVELTGAKGNDMMNPLA